MVKKFTLLLFTVLFAINCYGLPQYSMLSGNKCINCHLNPHGSGVRNNLGWYTRNDVGLIKPESIGLDSFYAAITHSNEFLDTTLLFGFDFRYQTAMIGPPENPKRSFFGMQASPYIVISPFKWLTAEGSYDFYYNKNKKYPGQKSWSAFLQIQPGMTSPSLKAGFFTPAIGIHYDDHTALVSQVTGGGQAQLIPPDYAEYGAEINYDGLKWLSLSAGVFDASSMAENTIKDASGNTLPLVNKNKLSTALNASVWQRFFENKLNFQLGGSYYFVDDFNITAVFLNAGLTDKLSLNSEILWTDKKQYRKSRNFLIGLTYQLFDALLVEGRFEKAYTDDLINIGTWKTNQYLIGFHIIPLPFIEIRPEYRIFDREWVPGYQSQYAVQLHIFY